MKEHLERNGGDMNEGKAEGGKWGDRELWEKVKVQNEDKRLNVIEHEVYKGVCRALEVEEAKKDAYTTVQRFLRLIFDKGDE